MFDTDKAREFFSWKITIIGILLVTIVAIICITLLAQFGNGKFVIAPKIFSCTLVSHGNFSWPYMMVICFTVLWFVMIASAIVLHHQLKKSGRSLRNSLNRNAVSSRSTRTTDQLKASINRLESGMTKRVVIMVISYTLLYLPCKYQYSTILCKFWLIWSRYLY